MSGMNDWLAEGLITFIRAVWDPDTTWQSYMEKRRKNFQENPYAVEGGMPIALLVDGERVVGHVASIPCKVWAHGKESLMYWNAGLHLLDECRGKGLGDILPRKMMEELPLVSGFFVIEQQLRTHTKMGWTIVGKIPEYIKILNPRKVFLNMDLNSAHQMPAWLRKISNANKRLGWIVGANIIHAVLHIYYGFCKTLVSHEKRSRIVIRTVEQFDERMDEFWSQVKYNISCAQVRNARYLNWMFPHKQGWVKIVYEEDAKISGYALLAQRSFDKGDLLRGLSTLSIIDILWDSQKDYVLNSLILWIERFAIERNADLIIASLNNNKARSHFINHGYTRIPSTVHFAFHNANDNLRLSEKISDWFVTRGDADAAGSLGPKR